MPWICNKFKPRSRSTMLLPFSVVQTVALRYPSKALRKPRASVYACRKLMRLLCATAES